MDDQEKLARARAVAIGAGRLHEHLAFVVGYLDRREAELVQRVEDAESDIDFLLKHNGTRQIADLEARCASLQAELIDSQMIVKLAREWGQAIANLEAARKKDEDEQKKKGGESVKTANAMYTAAQIALKTHLALKAGLKPAEEPAITEP